MASFTKNKSGSWKAEIRRKGWPNIYKTFRVKRDAENWARATEDEILRGIYVPRADSEKITIDEALDRYVKEIVPKKKPNTQIGNIVQAKQLKSELGSYLLATLNTQKVAAYRDQRLDEGKSNNTVRLELALLSHLYNTAIREWGIGLALNPVTNVKKPSTGKGRNRRLVGNEEERLITACNEHPNPFLGWVVKIALYTAMRRSEILSLTRNDVDMNKRIVNLKDTKNNTPRTVPLTGSAFRTFEEVLQNTISLQNTELIFHGYPGKDGEIRPYTIGKVWIKAIQRAGIEDLRFHDLRHEATSRLVEAGFSDQEVSSITGHKSMQMLKRYTHLRSEELVDRLSTL